MSKLNAAQQAATALFVLFAIPITGMVLTGGLIYSLLYVPAFALAYANRWQCRLAKSVRSFVVTWLNAKSDCC